MDLLLPLNLPPFPFKITDNDGKLTLFDPIRKKDIVITPEEWVRQHFIQFLINKKKYPKEQVLTLTFHIFYFVFQQLNM